MCVTYLLERPAIDDFRGIKSRKYKLQIVWEM